MNRLISILLLVVTIEQSHAQDNPVQERIVHFAQLGSVNLDDLSIVDTSSFPGIKSMHHYHFFKGDSVYILADSLEGFESESISIDHYLFNDSLKLLAVQRLFQMSSTIYGGDTVIHPLVEFVDDVRTPPGKMWIRKMKLDTTLSFNAMLVFPDSIKSREVEQPMKDLNITLFEYWRRYYPNFEELGIEIE